MFNQKLIWITFCCRLSHTCPPDPKFPAAQCQNSCNILRTTTSSWQRNRQQSPGTDPLQCPIKCQLTGDSVPAVVSPNSAEKYSECPSKYSPAVPGASEPERGGPIRGGLRLHQFPDQPRFHNQPGDHSFFGVREWSTARCVRGPAGSRAEKQPGSHQRRYQIHHNYSNLSFVNVSKCLS